MAYIIRSGVRNTLILTTGPYSAGIDFSRQNLKSKVDPRTVKIETFVIAVYNIGIQI